MTTNYYYESISGTGGNDTVVADFAAANAIYDFDQYWAGWYGTITDITLWDRTVDAGAGNDMVIRDRPGDYTASPSIYHGFPGNVLVAGGTGQDTISYQTYEGGVRIDLVVDNGLGLGLAQAIGATPDPIFGTDELSGFEHAAGAIGNDSINGSTSANSLWGLSGADTIRGNDGNDRIYGDADNDSLFGDAGADTVWGGHGRDHIRGGTGADSLNGGDGNDTIHGEDHDDLIQGGAGNDLVWAGDGHDVVYGGAGVDQLRGGEGNDQIIIEGSGGSAWGEEGNDVVVGNTGNDNLMGHAGNDILVGNAGADTLNGGEGADTVNGGSGFDLGVWEGLAGVTLVLDNVGNGTAVQGGVTDQLTSLEWVITGGGADKVTAGSGASRIETGSGTDTVSAGNGNDTVYGGNDADRIEGGWGNDVLLGENGHDRVSGGQNGDVLIGGSGNDTLRGGDDADTLTGGSGSDAFHWQGGDTGAWDIVTDFLIGTDRILFTNFLDEPLDPGESWTEKVTASSAEGGASTALAAKTANGWGIFAILRGEDDTAAVQAAIADGSLFGGGVSQGPSGELFG